MYETFNCGIGMIVFVINNEVNDTLDILRKFNPNVYICGKVSNRKDGETQIKIN